MMIGSVFKLKPVKKRRQAALDLKAKKAKQKEIIAWCIAGLIIVLGISGLMWWVIWLGS